ncbi:hypothetical protein G6F56_008197 [Rhizopus delemar]|nr:hypothetical protein G6F56_008197 [Rhizopus delemar]
MRVRKSTFKSIFKLYRDTGRVKETQRGGRIHNHMNDEYLQFIKDRVDENPSVTFGTTQDTMKTIPTWNVHIQFLESVMH